MSEEQTVVITEAPAVESEARAQGWVPKEEFRGKEEDWIEAEIFVQRGKEINPILRKNNERIQKELDLTKRQMEELRRTTEEFKAFQKEAYERKLKDYETELSDLKDLKKKAVSEGDGDMVVALDDKIDELKAQKSAEKPPKEAESQTQQYDPKVQEEIAAWTSENSWYSTDTKLRTITDAVAKSVRAEHPFLVGKEFLDELDKALEDVLPAEKTGKKERPRSPVSGSKTTSQDSGKAGKKSYDSLPADAKAACDKFVRQKLMTKEDYVSSYDWS